MADQEQILRQKLSELEDKAFPLRQQLREIGRVKEEEKKKHQKKVYIIMSNTSWIVAVYDTQELAKAAHSGMCNEDFYEIREFIINEKSPEQIHKEYFDPF